MEEDLTVLQHGGGWVTNIGNAFIDYGSMYSIEQAIDANVHVTSSYGRWTAQQMTRRPKDFLTGDLGTDENQLNVPKHADIDYVVQSGTCLSDHWFSVYGDGLFGAKEGGAEIVLYGVGMTDSTYTDEEIQQTREWVKELDPYVLVSRDEQTYEAFHDLATHSYNGIDNGFFVNDAYDPLPYSGDYTAVNFDKRPEPNHESLDIPDGEDIFRSHHSFWLDFNLTEFRKMYKEYYSRPNTLISDVPDDYLDLYASANQTYSDRVHACVATLSYGNKAHLSHSTPRSLLFERVGMGDVTEGLISPKKQALEEEKDKQIEFLSDVL